MTKLASELVPGDKTVADDGRTLTVASIRRGYIQMKGGLAVMIRWRSGEWSQVPRAAKIALV